MGSSYPTNPLSGKDGYYLYGFVSADAPQTYGPIGLEGPTDEVFTVPWKDLAAVVSRAPAKPLVSDPEKAIAHTRILEEIMKHTTVVPSGFGTVFDSQHTLTRALQSNAAELRQILSMLSNRIELGLEVAWRKEVLQSQLEGIASSDPEVAALKHEAEKGGGNGLPVALSLGELVQTTLDEKAEETRQQLMAPLRKLAVATRRNDIRTERTIMNEAFLVERDQEAVFDRAVEELVAKNGDRLEFRYTGPWPPFSFASIKVDRVE